MSEENDGGFTPKDINALRLLALGLGIVFEMPTLVMFLARVGMVTPKFLIKHTKYAILIIFIVAAIVTPGSDPLSLFLVAVPMIGLYAISIIVAWLFKKRTPALVN